MSEHAERFTGRVDVYEKYRPRYPAAVVDVLRQRCGLKQNDLVADIGAGTGMLAEILLEAGNRVVAIKPNAEMRVACERLAARFDKLRVLDAAAEATGLEDASVGLVTVGWAFHWFDQARASKEFARVLKPAGWVALVLNRRDREATAAGREYEQILLEHGTDYGKVRAGYRSFEGLKPYGDGETFAVKMPGEVRLTRNSFWGRHSRCRWRRCPGMRSMRRCDGHCGSSLRSGARMGCCGCGRVVRWWGGRRPARFLAIFWKHGGGVAHESYRRLLCKPRCKAKVER
jgi:SAM-dependent methyltransferase